MDIQDMGGNTALHAVFLKLDSSDSVQRAKAIEIANMFLSHGASVGIKNGASMTPIEMAHARGIKFKDGKFE